MWKKGGKVVVALNKLKNRLIGWNLFMIIRQTQQTKVVKYEKF